MRVKELEDWRDKISETAGKLFNESKIKYQGVDSDEEERNESQYRAGASMDDR